MKLSKIKLFNSIKIDKNKKYSTTELLEHYGFIHQVSSGLFVQMYLMKNLSNNIEKVIRENLNKVYALEVGLNQLQNADMWKQTGRYETYGEEMFKLKDRNDKEMVITGTNEELVTLVAKNYITSYKDLDFTFYQINDKFRDEIRCNTGLIRCKEFSMMDAYSFHATQEGLELRYDEIRECYKAILDTLGLTYRIEKADSGEIGGSVSEEFIVETSDGEIEIGHIFQLGTKYSSKLGVKYVDNTNKKQDVIMGCYGIGISRLAQVVVDKGRVENCFNFNTKVSPIHTYIVVADVKDQEQLSVAEKAYSVLLEEGVNVVLDDRAISVGAKLNEADNIGCCYKILIGKNIHSGFIERKTHSTDEWTKKYITELKNITV